MNENNELMTVQAGMAVQQQDDALMAMDYDNVLELAERADRMVGALNKIMQAAIRITTARDWVLIGGTPYLQEAGASKVARLFGISWKICDGYPKQELDREGYPTYTYRMVFQMGGQRIEAEGMRNAADEFFIGKPTDRNGNPVKQKTVDEIDLADVKRAAYTNCLNRGIKGILPGLRNLDVADLECAGINLGKTGGYTFKTGTRGGKTEAERASDFVCAVCGDKISQKVASFSQGKYGRAMCMSCQKAVDSGAVSASATPEDDYERPPFPGDEDLPGGGR